MRGALTFRVGLATLVVTLVMTGGAAANTFPVTRTDDPAAGACDADCSLREAVTAANGHMGTDVIVLQAKTYTLSQGQLPDVTDDLVIAGAGAGKTIITGSTAAGPAETTRAGVLVLQGPAGLGVLGVTISGNEATVDDPASQLLTIGAGAIAGAGGGTLTLVGSAVRGNRLTAAATSGAGGVINSGPLTVVNSTIAGNSVAPLGGSSTTTAGGVMVNSASSGRIESSTVSGNTVTPLTHTTVAGGVLSNVTPLTMTNSTVSGNSVGAGGTVTSRGGGVYSNVSDMTLTHVTVADNSVAGSGAAGGNLRAGPSGTRILRNSIVAHGTAPSGANCSGTWASEGGNVETANECGLDIALGDQANTEPQLGPLASNGGPTATRAIPVTSPAIDAALAAFCSSTDQRAVLRPQGAGCDAGAFELGPPANAARPRISGTVRQGLRVTCVRGTWRDAASFAFAWLRDGDVITGAGSQTYRVRSADTGHALQCRVRATNPSGSTTAESKPRAALRACIVPNLRGVKLDRARQRLTAAGCAAGSVTRKSSPSVAAGRVVSTKPSAGSNRPFGTKVALVVSRG